jgi:hypothetical protein
MSNLYQPAASSRNLGSIQVALCCYDREDTLGITRCSNLLLELDLPRWLATIAREVSCGMAVLIVSCCRTEA